MTTYIFNCPICEKETLAIISKVSRKRGVKLTCLRCGSEAKCYTKSKLKQESDSMAQVESAPLIPEIKTALEVEQELKK